MRTNFSINLEPELHFKASRSSGKGGQNVNKVSTKIELNFDVLQSSLLDEKQKNLILEKLKHRISKEGILRIVVQTERSQLANKEIAREKFYQLLMKCFEQKKKRLATKPSKVSKEKRINQKKITSEKKARRRNREDR